VPAGDSDLLARARENLLDNGICYTQAGGEVRMSWRAEGKQRLFRVSDTGPGIAAHDLKHIFEPRYCVEDSRGRQTSGTGIGLATEHRMLQAHGGGLAAADAPTGGAIFSGTLPCFVGR
jgi:signal transduction histidine kinase